MSALWQPACSRAKPGDWILTAPETDPESPLEVKQVEEVFATYARLLTLEVRGRVIRTTSEHPFWVRGKGWTSAGDLQIGQELRSHDGTWVPLAAITDDGEQATVYNLRVQDYHTYFVGSEAWGFSVWAHNACGAPTGPKTDNRFGHNRMIRQVARDVTASGDTVLAGGRMFDGTYRKEAVFDTTGGFKGSRRPDLLVQRPDGSIYGVNVGRTEASGVPVLRERLAIQDLNEQAGLEMLFVGYGRKR